jgi:tRNA(adenine34) deaminase
LVPGCTDSGRYLAAGAAKSYWMRGDLERAVAALREILAANDNVIVESNSVLRFIEPDLYLLVVGGEMKESAKEFADRADMVFRHDERWMLEAIALAVEAEAAGEVPVGAVVVAGGLIVGRGFNSPITRNDPTAHAEILALREAGATLGNYRLEDATLYVTMEPCVMCAGALVAARVKRVVFGCRDLRFGGVRARFRLADSELLNHQVIVTEGVLAPDCVALLQRFFADRR